MSGAGCSRGNEEFTTDAHSKSQAVSDIFVSPDTPTGRPGFLLKRTEGFLQLPNEHLTDSTIDDPVTVTAPSSLEVASG